MENLVKFPLADGDCVVVHLKPARPTGPVPAANSPPLREAALGFEAAAAKLRPIAQTLLAQIKDLGPDEVRLELSVRFCAEVGLILARSGGEGHCKLGMVWKRR